MPHELHASVCVTLPDGPHELAEGISVATGAWAEFLETIRSHKPTSTLAINETRAAKSPHANGVKRGRKPKAFQQPETIILRPGEDDRLA